MYGVMRLPEIVGVLNLSPDSFSDGKEYSATEIVPVVRQLLHDGATIIDVGAESTRPNATPLSAMEEWLRLNDTLPTVVQVAHAAGARVSIDTRHAAVAQQAIALGVDWVNDVSGITNDAMLDVLQQSSARYVVTHSLSVPADPRIVLPETVDVVGEVLQALHARVQALELAGIQRERLILDPGIGFGKTAPQSLQLIHGMARLQVLGCELLVGHSRKSFLAPFTLSDPAQRDAGTLAVSLYLAQKGVEYLRVHQVAMHRQALDVWKGLHDVAC